MRLPTWIRNEKQRQIVSFIGGGLAVAAGAAWTTFTYFSGKTSFSAEVTYMVCLAKSEGECPDQTVFVEDENDNSLENWVKLECAKYKRVEGESVSPKGGGSIIAKKPFRLVQIKCKN